MKSRASRFVPAVAAAFCALGIPAAAPAQIIRPISLATNDIIFNPSDNLIYATRPSTAGAGAGNSVTRINPTTAGVGASVFVGSEPGKLAISDNGSVSVFRPEWRSECAPL